MKSFQALMTCFLCLALPGWQLGNSQRPAGLLPTQFATQVLQGDRLLVVATAETVTLLGMGTAVVRLRVGERLAGEGPGAKEELLLLAHAREFHVGNKALLVLEPFGKGGRYRVRFRVDTREVNYLQKLEMCRLQVAIIEGAPPNRLVPATLELLTNSLVAPDKWTRNYALSELAWISNVHPEFLTASRLAELRSVALISPWPEVTDGVESVLAIMARRTEALRARAQQESSSL
ncbi:MAG: hypothetical protein P8N09_08055 [Planctomycetota bacterium]|nr:hypothetical protein [Planctomycetota bacterium]